MRKKPTTFILVCIAPAVILTMIFMLLPMINAVYLSFTDATALSVGTDSKFVFLENYKYMFGDEDFLVALKNSAKLMAVVPVVTIFLSLVSAFILTQSKLKEKKVYRIIFFLPSIISMTVVGIIWSFVFNPNQGILNQLLRAVQLDSLARPWLGDSKTVLWCIAVTLVWQSLGYYMVMHVAAIDGISGDVYEAAAIDGASSTQQFFRITVPLLRTSIGTTFILSLSGTINLSFTLSNVMTAGGPNGASAVLLQYMYTQGMRNANFGYAMAIAMFTLFVAIVLAVLSKRLTSERE